MAFADKEKSRYDSEPAEGYVFEYNGTTYCYTSADRNIDFTLNGQTYRFKSDYIHRGESLKLGDSGGSIETCDITVSSTNDVALLYRGSPPELSAVKVTIYRIHGNNQNDYIIILNGILSQVKFSDSEATLTVTVEKSLDKYIPRGTLSYYCQNSIYDNKCTLYYKNYELYCPVSNIIGLTIYSNTLLLYPDGYFDDGYLLMNNAYRGVIEHKRNWVKIKYMINPEDLVGYFYIYPGCKCLFTRCADIFHNTDNFSGVPYITPYNAFKHPVNKGTYWVDDSIIIRDTNGYIHTMN